MRPVGWDAAIERVFSTGNQEEMGFDLAGPSGMRTFALKFAPEFGPDHEIQYVLGVSSDITDRKKAEKALQESEERLALAISAGRLATWDRLMATDEVVWNDEHFRIMGYEPGEVKPGYQAWAERVHPDDRSKAEAAFARSLEVGGDFSTEFRVLWPDGTVRWASRFALLAS
jgi:PAS domain-containing protein